MGKSVYHYPGDSLHLLNEGDMLMLIHVGGEGDHKPNLDTLDDPVADALAEALLSTLLPLASTPVPCDLYVAL